VGRSTIGPSSHCAAGIYSRSVRILLPPSEAKRPDRSRRRRSGPVADTPIGALGLNGSPLTESRELVARALVAFCGADPLEAARALALPARSADADLAANRALFQAPIAPALDRYAGTVYEGLDAASLTTAGRRRAMESVLIFSGLFGVLRADEAIPAYRLPVGAVLPNVGALTPFWRSMLLREPGGLRDRLGDELIVDLRSTDYSAMWRATGSMRDQVVVVRVVSEQPDGRLAVISYPSKHGKGRLARALLSSRARITSAAQVANAWTAAGGRDAIAAPGGGLDLLT
jgi:uncharacterized protein